jgi:hypothetical protein
MNERTSRYHQAIQNILLRLFPSGQWKQQVHVRSYTDPMILFDLLLKFSFPEFLLKVEEEFSNRNDYRLFLEDFGFGV